MLAMWFNDRINNIDKEINAANDGAKLVKIICLTEIGCHTQCFLDI